jgi:hypothetical protein
MEMVALERLGKMRTLRVGNLALHGLPEAHLTRHAQLAQRQTLARMGEERCLVTLLVFGQTTLERTATDDILGLSEALLTALALRGEMKHYCKQLWLLKDLRCAVLVLHQALGSLFNETVPDGSIWQQALSRFGETPLRAAADALQPLASGDDDWQLQAESK